MIKKNETWELVDKPKDRKVIGVKWVYKTKLNPDGTLNKHKARLVVKGYSHQAGENDLLIISLYVDDLLVTGNNPKMIVAFKEEMKKRFEMTDLGLMNYFLGMEVHQSEDGIFISQSKYAEDILKKFKMQHSKAVATPLVVNEKFSKNDGQRKVDPSVYKSLVGSLLYLTATRPDIMFAASMLSRFMNEPSEVHMGAAKRVLRYLKGTSDFGILYQACSNPMLVAYSDSDWGGSIDDMKSTNGYVFSFGSGVFSWISKKQDDVAQSTAEAEYIAASTSANQVAWLRKVFEDMGFKQDCATEVMVDNKSAIAISKNPVCFSKTKHMKIKFYALREAEQEKNVELVYCPSEFQLADILTKALPKGRFEFLRHKLGVTTKVSRRSVNA
ncbi:hypothetical protein RND81_10G078400 [Saponaria officinalis]|uniref:Reverse transcriptase Ty1/copia-type domain-containing protein n=1 Tax=Saponaria officinalis TaxID=3572 RepID=A0AAW1HZE0_SAPOF